MGVFLDRQSSLNETGKHLGKPLGFVPDGIECSLENRELVPWRPGHGGFEHGDVSAQGRLRAVMGEGKESGDGERLER